MTFLDEFRSAVLRGLASSEKSIPCRFLYDARGTELFVQITKLPGYYLTRCEKAVLKEFACEMGQVLPEGLSVVELGSGVSEKTPALLSGLRAPKSFTPVDIDTSALDQSVDHIGTLFPDLSITPLQADFTDSFDLPGTVTSPVLGFFPGSTIGNFDADDAAAFLRRLRESLGGGATLLLGADLVKDEDSLLLAYDDPEGVTRDFIKNVLVRINRELGGTFEIEDFSYRAIWDEARAAVRMYLVSDKPQTVDVGDKAIEFAEGEAIHIEDSHKYTQARLESMGQQSGWAWQRVWTDPDGLYGVHLFNAI